MADVSSFLKTHWPSILTVVVTFLTLITTFKILKINFNPNVEKHIEKVVTIEAFNDKVSISSVEDANKDDLHAQHKICQGFSKETADKTSMCVCLDGDRCVGGNRRGPTFKTEKGEDVDFKYYTHKGKCYGADCPQ